MNRQGLKRSGAAILAAGLSYSGSGLPSSPGQAPVDL
jgi:hypothetical protein